MRADAAAEFRQILTQAVEARLRGGEAGAVLSGGLDSSSIACTAAPLLRARNAGPLRTFSLVFDETPEFNERPFIEVVLVQGGFAPTFISSNRLAPFAVFDRIIGEQQDLFLAPNLPSSRQIPHIAPSQSIRVLLDGHGGDQVAPVGGGPLHELGRAQKWIMLWRQLMTGYDTSEGRKLPIFWRFFVTAQVGAKKLIA